MANNNATYSSSPARTTLLPCLLRFYNAVIMSMPLVLRQSSSYYVIIESLLRCVKATFTLRKFLTCSVFSHVLADLMKLLLRQYRSHHALPLFR